jgi:hypothetical protein
MKFIRTRHTPNGRRTVYYNDVTKSYIKYYDYCQRDWYEDHCHLMDKYYPGYLVSRSCLEHHMILGYKEIEGITLRASECTNETIHKLIQSNGNPIMIDLDTFSDTRLPTMEHVINQIHRDLKESLGKKKFGNYWKYYCKRIDS